MKKSDLEGYIENGMSQRQMAIKLNKSHGSIKYWLKKFNLETNLTINPCKSHECLCGETSPKNFYGTRKSECKVCENIKNIQKSKDNKLFGVTILGGECLHCGYKKCIGALEFHHLEPKYKDPDFTGLRCWSKKRIEKELKKCILLCGNCHSEEHERLEEVRLREINMLV